MNKYRDEYTHEAAVLRQDRTIIIGCTSLFGLMLLGGVLILLSPLFTPMDRRCAIAFVIMGAVLCSVSSIVIFLISQGRHNKTVFTSAGISFVTGKDQKELFIPWDDVEQVCYTRSLYYGHAAYYHIRMKNTGRSHTIPIDPAHEEKIRKFVPQERFAMGGSYYS